MEGSLSMICWLVVFAVMVVIVLVGWQYLIKWQREQELLYEQKLQEQLDPMTREWEERVLKLQEENEKLQQSHLRAHKYDEGQMKLQNHAAVEQKTFENQINELKSQVDRLLAYKTRMHTAIQQHSRQALVEK
jgi:predicted negative regulator of RcsB-dependent stress response